MYAVLKPPWLRQGDLVVRPLDPDLDTADLFRLRRDPDNDRWGAPFFVPRPVSADAFRGRLVAEREHALAGEPATYAVVDAGSGRLLGDVAWRLDSPLLGVVDLGYGTLPEARGRGVARTGLRLLAEWLMDAGRAGVPFDRAQLDHAVENVASCKVALAAGFEREGVRASFLPLCDPDRPAGWYRADVCLHGRVA